MKRAILIVLAIFVSLPAVYCIDKTNLTSQSPNSDEKLGVGLGFPFACIRYKFIPEIAGEFRYAAGEGINVTGGRLYWNFPIKTLSIFTGVEYGFVSFSTLDISGTGSEASLFIGGEYFLADKFSFHMDLGPSFIALKNENASVDGIEWVTNIALYYYIF